MKEVFAIQALQYKEKYTVNHSVRISLLKIFLFKNFHSFLSISYKKLL